MTAPLSAAATASAIVWCGAVAVPWPPELSASTNDVHSGISFVPAIGTARGASPGGPPLEDPPAHAPRITPARTTPNSATFAIATCLIDGTFRPLFRGHDVVAK